MTIGGVPFATINWSLPVALVTLFATAVWRFGLWAPLRAAKPPWYGTPPLTRSHVLFLLFTAWIGRSSSSTSRSS